MRPRQKVSRQGLALIEAFEGFRPTAARLPDGRWTIGYGHTKSAREGAEVSGQDAEALLLFDLMPVVEAVNGLVFTPLSQNQFDALCAFVFNVGIDAFRGSDVLKRVNEGRLTEAACEIDLWRKGEVGGDPLVLDGLVRRRTAEKALFLTPLEGHTPIPSVLVRPTVDIDAPEVLPTSRPVETDAPLEGPAAELHRTDAPAAPEPDVEAPSNVVTAVFAAAEIAIFQAPQPASEAPVSDTQVHAGMPSADAISYFAEGPKPSPHVEPQPEPEPEAVPDPAPPVAVAPDPAPPAAPQVQAAADPASGFAPMSPPAAPEPIQQPVKLWPQAPTPKLGSPPMSRSVAETVSHARIYGPMAAAALGRNMAKPANEDRAAEAKPEPRPDVAPTAANEIARSLAPEPQSFQPPPPPSIPTPVAPAPMPVVQPELQPAPQAHAPPPEPLVLTHPPEEWPVARPEPMTQTAPQAAADPSLFQEGWAGGEPTRVVRHEATPADDGKRGSSAPFILMSVIGLVAFAGAVAAFLRGRTGGDMTIFAWILALIGVGCVAVSVFFLLKRVGGDED
ncbi:MAG TPA: glycoside hydrolase family protein [Caulobacteraceae bacterium]|jgi:lysozyme|nr:glycoside hydrolase family protein [Caulobacteraceae bacterium]